MLTQIRDLKAMNMARPAQRHSAAWHACSGSGASMTVARSITGLGACSCSARSLARSLLLPFFYKRYHPGSVKRHTG